MELTIEEARHSGLTSPLHRKLFIGSIMGPGADKLNLFQFRTLGQDYRYIYWPASPENKALTADKLSARWDEVERQYKWCKYCEGYHWDNDNNYLPTREFTREKFGKNEP